MNTTAYLIGWIDIRKQPLVVEQIQISSDKSPTGPIWRLSVVLAETTDPRGYYAASEMLQRWIADGHLKWAAPLMKSR